MNAEQIQAIMQGGARAGRPRWVKILLTTSASSMAAMRSIGPLQQGHIRTARPHVRRISTAHESLGGQSGRRGRRGRRVVAELPHQLVVWCSRTVGVVSTVADRRALLGSPVT